MDKVPDAFIFFKPCWIALAKYECFGKLIICNYKNINVNIPIFSIIKLFFIFMY